MPFACYVYGQLLTMSSLFQRFGDPKGSMLGLLGALYQIGSVSSIPFVPFCTDHYGRKLPIIGGCFIMIAGAVMQGAGSTLPVFMGGRFLLGFGNSFTQLSSPMLLTEICHPQHRARLTTVYNCLWNVGALFVSWLAFGTDYLFNDWSWRIPALLQAFPSVIQLAFIWFVPESPRYLIAKDRSDEALQILGKYHANGNTQHPTVQFEYREIKETLALELAAKKQSSYLDFMKTKGNRYRLAVLISLGVFSQWSGNAIISSKLPLVALPMTTLANNSIQTTLAFSTKAPVLRIPPRNWVFLLAKLRSH